MKTGRNFSLHEPINKPHKYNGNMEVRKKTNSKYMKIHEKCSHHQIITGMLQLL